MYGCKVVKGGDEKFVRVKVAVYGTLRKGGKYYKYYLGKERRYKKEKVKYLGKTRIYGFRMYRMVYDDFPISVVGDKDDFIVAEVYEIGERTYSKMCRMEASVGFYPLCIETEYGDCYIFIYPDRKYWSMTHIENGDWIEYAKKSMR